MKMTKQEYDEDIARWTKTAKGKNFKYVLIVCDTFSYEDYPVYCKDSYELKQKTIEYNGKRMQQVMKTIDI